MAQAKATLIDDVEVLTEEELQAAEGVAEIFHWNQRKALSNMLMMEEHMKELEESQIPNSWCIVKHYLLALDHHLDEAIGHADRIGIDSTPYRRFKTKFEDLNAYPEPHFNIGDIVKLRTEWRGVIADPTLTGDCPLCSKDITPEMVKALKGQKHGAVNDELLELEQEYANKVHDVLAIQKGEAKVPFMIVDCGNVEPTNKALAVADKHGAPFIAYCSGGVASHIAIHEHDHTWKHKAGECDLNEGNCSEYAAESLALSELSNSFNLNTHISGVGQGNRLVGKKETMSVYSASIFAKLLQRGFEELDGTVTIPVGGLTGIYAKPSFWLNVLLGVVPPVMQLYMGKKFPLMNTGKLPVLVASAHFASKLVDYAEEQYFPAARLPVRSVRKVPVRSPAAATGGVAIF